MIIRAVFPRPDPLNLPTTHHIQHGRVRPELNANPAVEDCMHEKERATRHKVA
jgi:hypothetical protein